MAGPETGTLAKRRLSARNKLIILAIIAAIVFIAVRESEQTALRELEARLGAAEGFSITYSAINLSLLQGVRITEPHIRVSGGMDLKCNFNEIKAGLSITSAIMGKAMLKNVFLDSPVCSLVLDGDAVHPVNNVYASNPGASDLSTIPSPRSMEISNGELVITFESPEQDREISISGIYGSNRKNKGDSYNGKLSFKEIHSGNTTIKKAVAGYSINGGHLLIKGFRGRLMDGSISAIADINFGVEGKPLTFEATLADVEIRETSDMFFDPDGIFSGKISGAVEYNGSLFRPDSSEWTANLSSRAMDARIPLKATAQNPGPEDILPLDNLKLSLKSHCEKGIIRIDASAVNNRSEIRIENSVIDIIPGGDNAKKIDFYYDIVMTVTIDNIKRVTDSVSGFDTPFDGRMSTHFSVARKHSTGDAVFASGHVLFSDGVIYQTPSTAADERKKKRIEYDKLRTEFIYRNKSLTLSDLSIRGKDINFEARGEISSNGKIDIRGRSELKPELATRLFGWNPADSADSPGNSKTVDAIFTMKGSTDFPVVNWRPRKQPGLMDTRVEEKPATPPESGKKPNILQKIRGMFSKAF